MFVPEFHKTLAFWFRSLKYLELEKELTYLEKNRVKKLMFNTVCLQKEKETH